MGVGGRGGVNGKLTGAGGQSQRGWMYHSCGCQMSLRMVTIVEVEKIVSKNLQREDSGKGVSR